MVLQYLPLIASGLSLLSQMKGVHTAAQPIRATGAEKAQLQALSNQQRLLQTLTNPNDVILRNLTAQNSKLLNIDTQNELSNLISANRRQRLLGRQSFFNPEREDESINQFMNRRAQEVGPLARSTSLSQIIQAINGQSGLASNFGGLIPNQQAARDYNNSRTQDALNKGSDVVSALPGFMNQFQNIYSAMGSRA